MLKSIQIKKSFISTAFITTDTDEFLYYFIISVESNVFNVWICGTYYLKCSFWEEETREKDRDFFHTVVEYSSVLSSSWECQLVHKCVLGWRAVVHSGLVKWQLLSHILSRITIIIHNWSSVLQVRLFNYPSFLPLVQYIHFYPPPPILGSGNVYEFFPQSSTSLLSVSISAGVIFPLLFTLSLMYCYQWNNLSICDGELCFNTFSTTTSHSNISYGLQQWWFITTHLRGCESLGKLEDHWFLQTIR